MENYLNIGFIIIFLNEKLCHKTNAIIDRKLIFFKNKTLNEIQLNI